MKTILHLHNRAKELVSKYIPISEIKSAGLFDKLIKMKYDIPNDRLDMFEEYIKTIDMTIDQILDSRK